MPCGQTVPGRKLAAKWLWSWRCGSHFFWSLKQLRERNEIYRNTEEKCEPHSFKVQLLQPSMCCSSKGGDFGLAAYPNLENLPRLHLNRLRHIREARGCASTTVLFVFRNYCTFVFDILYCLFNTPSKIEMPRSFGKTHVQWNRNTVMSWTVPGGWDDLRINMVV